MIGNGDILLNNYCLTKFFYLRLWFSLLHTNYTLSYTLSRKKNKIKIHGGFGSTWGDNFYMGTQNGSKLEI